METYISTDCPENSCETLLAGLLSFIHESSFLSHWYRLWNRADDNPTQEVRRLSKEEHTNKIDQLNQSSLPRYVGIDHDKWIYLLERCGLVSVSADGKVSMTNVEKWNSFFITYDILAEVEPANCLRTNKRWYIRLGKKGPNWIDKAATQAKKGKLVPPRCPNIEYIGRRLNAELNDMIIDEEEDGWGDACGRDTGDIAINNNNNSNSNESQSQRGNDELQAETGPTTPTKYPLLESLQLKDIRLADIDLSDDAQHDRFKRILGEMVAKQQQYTNNKNRIEYFQLRQNTTTTAVAIHPHMSEAAYQKFHGKNPYLDDVVECLDNDVKVGASRGLVDYKNDTPKLHCIEDHAVDALERFPDLLLMIEEWVEQFHQTEKKRVENRVRFIKDAFKRAESASKKRAAVNDSTLMVQSRRTKKPRGGYKPKNV